MTKAAKHPHKDEMLKVLESMKEARSEDSNEQDSFLAYAKVWVEKVNRGGLILVDDNAFHLFLAMEYATRKQIRVDPLVCNEKRKDEVAKKIACDADVDFHWSQVTSMHTFEEAVMNELLHRLTCQWLTVRGFSSAAAFIEDYKHAERVSLLAKKALRKELKKAEQSDTTE